MKVIVITPTYNEASNIETTIREIFKYLPEAELLVVDDNSPDGTGHIVTRLQGEFPLLKLLRRPVKSGLGDAYLEAFTVALNETEAEIIITMDADGSHDPKYLPIIVESLIKTDLVIGSRYIVGGGIVNWAWYRRILSRGGNLYERWVTGLPISDLTSGYMGFRRSLLVSLEGMRNRSTHYAFLMELKYLAVKVLGASLQEVPIVFTERREGVSKMSGAVVWESLFRPWRLRKLVSKS